VPDSPKPPEEPVKYEDFKKQLELVVQETKKLEADIEVLQKLFLKGNFRML
jgi:hypothetical protein